MREQERLFALETENRELKARVRELEAENESLYALCDAYLKTVKEKDAVAAIEAKNGKVTVYREKGEVLIVDSQDEGCIE